MRRKIVIGRQIIASNNRTNQASLILS